MPSTADQSEQTMTDIDTEVETLRTCFTALSALDKEAQGRALRYLAQRLGVPLFITPSTPGFNGGAITITPCNGPAQYHHHHYPAQPIPVAPIDTTPRPMLADPNSTTQPIPNGPNDLYRTVVTS